MKNSRQVILLLLVLVAGAVVMALLGGVVVAFFLSEGLGMPFRAVWIGASLVLFVIPAAAFLLKRGQD